MRRAEKAQAGAAHNQIQTLNLFDGIFTLNQDRPERIKAILPRFVNYVACHIMSASQKIFNYGKVILRIRTHVKTQTNA